MKVKTPSRLIGTKEAAMRCALSESMIRKEVQAGRIPHFKIGRSTRIGIEDLETWMMSRRVKC